MYRTKHVFILNVYTYIYSAHRSVFIYLSAYPFNILHDILSLKILKMLYFYFLRFIAMVLNQRQCLETSLVILTSGRGGGWGNGYLVEAKDATKHPTMYKTFPLPVSIPAAAA